MMDWQTPEYDRMCEMAKSGENLTPRVILRAIYEITGILLSGTPNPELPLGRRPSDGAWVVGPSGRPVCGATHDAATRRLGLSMRA